MKNVLLLVHDDAGQESRFQAALDITRAVEGHLTCLNVAIYPMFVSDAYAISVEAALSYLGLGLSIPYVSWGTMIRDAQEFLEVAPWLAIFPGLTLAGVILAFTIVGDALRDRIDPRLSRSLSRQLRGRQE